MGYANTIPVSLLEAGSNISGDIITILSGGSSADFPIVYIPSWIRYKVGYAYLQLNIPYVFNAHGANNWFTSFLCTVSPDDNAHTYTAIDATADNTFMCQNGATSSLTQWLGTVDLRQYVEDAVTYGIGSGLTPHFHVNITATAHGDSIAFMLHSAVVKIYLKG